jgi:hypothetical protein
MSFSNQRAAGVNFKTILNSFAQAPGLPFQDALTVEYVERVATEEEVNFGAAPGSIYNVWYRDLGPDGMRRQQRWREFLLGEDPHEDAVRRGDWIEGSENYRRRMQRAEARPTRRRGRPRKPPPGQEGFFPEFYEAIRDP